MVKVSSTAAPDLPLCPARPHLPRRGPISSPQIGKLATIYSTKHQAGSVDLTRTGLAGAMEADVMLERAVALDSGCTLLGMRLYTLELCSVY